jgi:D-sedoheptulose 7-phosphate isomerase
MQDPRHRNELFDRSEIGAYLRDYARRLHDALAAVDAAALDRARVLIEAAGAAGGRVYSIGNGGSAAVADHLCCDWTKGTHAPGHPVIHSQSMTANMALYSAVANDFGFEQVFAHQIELIGRPGDLLVAISSSGNSPNILNAVEAARARGMASIGLCGFAGGALKDAADVTLHVDIANYGIVEDAHQALMHVLAQFIAAHRDGSSE